MSEISPIVAVTGARGWLGSCVARAFRAEGWKVRELIRQPEASAVARGEAAEFRLGEPIAPSALEGVRALVHCAYDFTGLTWPEIERKNVRGSEQLFRAAREAGVSRVVEISTMSAFAGCQSLYGRAKLAIEEIAAREGALILRPGLIYGDGSGGMFGSLVRQVRGASRLPLIGGGGQILYAIHEADLARFIVAFCAGTSAAPAEPITAAHEQPWTFRQLLEAIAAQMGKRLSFIPVPWRAVWLPLKLAEMLGVRLNFRSDSLVSLVNQNPHPDFASRDRAGLAPRAFSLEGIAL